MEKSKSLLPPLGGTISQIKAPRRRRDNRGSKCSSQRSMPIMLEKARDSFSAAGSHRGAEGSSIVLGDQSPLDHDYVEGREGFSTSERRN